MSVDPFIGHDGKRQTAACQPSGRRYEKRPGPTSEQRGVGRRGGHAAKAGVGVQAKPATNESRSRREITRVADNLHRLATAFDHLADVTALRTIAEFGSEEERDRIVAKLKGWVHVHDDYASRVSQERYDTAYGRTERDRERGGFKIRWWIVGKDRQEVATEGVGRGSSASSAQRDAREQARRAFALHRSSNGDERVSAPNRKAKLPSFPYDV